MTWIKSNAKYLCILVFMLTLAPLTSFAQTVNSDLSDKVKMEKRNASEAAAKRLTNALATNNQTGLKEFVPTREVYQSMMETYQFRSVEDKEKAQRRLDTQYDQRVAALWKNIETIQKQFLAGNATVGEYHFRLKKTQTMFGGRSTVLVQFANKTSRKLRIGSFYEHNGKWYILGNLRWVD